MLVQIDADFAEQARLSYERGQARRARYEAKKRRGRHDANETRENGHVRTFHYRDYPFIGWDGEAPQDTGYSLFGSSAGHEVCEPALSTESCFNLLLAAKEENPHSIFVWFGGRYDWDEITRASIPLTKLARLKMHGVLWWHGYRLTEIEGKIYSITRDGIRAVIYEISGWFGKAYVRALRDYGIRCDRCLHGSRSCDLDDMGIGGGYDSGSPGSDNLSDCVCVCVLCRMEAEKKRRGDFVWKEIAEIAEYMRDELACMPELMNRVREIVLKAGFDPKGWYGPSALGRQLLTRYKVFDYMAECPPEVNEAACFAFAGGRFEFFRGGILKYNCTADQNSAYMHAALDVPNLRAGQWRQGCAFEEGKFAVYHIRYRDRSRPVDVLKPNPLFRRLKNGNVLWPRRVTGWYWSPEAELVKDSPYAEFLDAWIFDEQPSERPFEFVHEVFDKRLYLQSLPADNPEREAEWALKRALASIYGQLARTVGWDKRTGTPPRTHQIEWAGYILSKCRANMYKVAIACGEHLVSIDTDSVTATCPIVVPEGIQLGEWKTEHHEAGVYFQNGVYFTLDDGKWSKGKTRGMERRRGIPPVNPHLLMTAIREGLSVRMRPKRRYVTTKMALAGQLKHHGQWREHPGNVLHFGGGGKRYHNAKFCPEYCTGNTHVMLPSVPIEIDDSSYPHILPWKGQVQEKHDIESWLWADTDNIDSDDEWLAELVEMAS